MKKYWIIAAICIIVSGLFAIQAPAHQGEDREIILEVMHQNTDFLGQFHKALEAQDYFIVAESLMGIAKAMKSLDEIIPERGSKEDWDEIHQDIINVAFKGIGACADEDAKMVLGYGEEIRLLMQMGHTLFR